MIQHFSYRRIFFAFGSWWLLWIALYTYILKDLGLNWEQAAIDSLVTHLVLAFSTFALYITLKYYQPAGDNTYHLRLWAILLAVLNTYLIQWLLGLIFTADPMMMQFISHGAPLRFAYQLLMVATIVLVNWISYFYQNRQELEARKADSERLAREAELFNLRQQLQPHFLFNSLNSIHSLAGSNLEEARNMIDKLSGFLRHTLRRDEHAMISLADEMKGLQLYLDIEKVRFGHRLQIATKMHGSCLERKVPALILQPILENAIKFGLYDQLGDVTIELTTTCVENNLEVTISNPFDPKSASHKNGTGFGLTSVQRRLFLLFSRHDLLSTSAEGERFVTRLTIPQ